MRFIASHEQPTQAEHENLNLCAAAGLHARRRQLLGAALWFFILALTVLNLGRAFGVDVAAPPSSPSTAPATGASPPLPHFLAALAAFVGTVRLFAKFIQTPLQNFLTAAIARVNDSPEKDDDQLLHNLFAAPWYRLLAFTLDYLLSLKLPTSDSLLTHREENPK